MKPIVRGLPLVRVYQYWWKGVPNFGDSLAPHLLEHFTAADLTHAPITDASIVTVGSVLEHIRPDWVGYICGAGKLHEASRPYLPCATILALRGPLSAQGVKGNFVLGDPGLLANELVGPQNKRWDLGIVPHWRDRELAPRFLQMFAHRPTVSVHVIDPLSRPLKVVQEIGACKRVVTSSLHGMIVADSFGIPRRVELAKSMMNEREGFDFKFRDYSESIRHNLKFGKMQSPVKWNVETRQHEIYDAYKVLERELNDDLQIL